MNIKDDNGFTLIEIAIVMVIIGLLMGGGISVISILSQKKSRNETVVYLKQAKEAIINFGCINGRLPRPDTNGDGVEDGNPAAVGDLPFITLGITPVDSYGRKLKYQINSNLGTNRSTTCSSIRTGISGNPLLVDADGSASSFPVAAVMISSGPMDADSDGNVFDDLAGTYSGDNTNGNPNYIRATPSSLFDDLVIYAGGNELFGEICGDPVFSVTNGGASTVYIYDTNSGNDLVALAAGETYTQRIMPGTIIQIRSAAGGGGSIVPSTPVTPITLAGNGSFISIP